MFSVLFRFWLRRFVFMFSIAFIMFFYWNYTHYAFTRNMLINTWAWALFAAVIASSLSTYFAYLRQRNTVKKSSPNSSSTNSPKE